MTRLVVVGSWHLATVMAACLAEKNHNVRVVHDDADAIESLSKGVPTVFEPKLAPSIKKSLREKRISFTTDFGKALKGIKIVFLSIDTPITRQGTIDIRPIEAAAVQIAKAASASFILVVASQVPIGSCEKLQALARKHGKHRCDVVCNPEFLRLGGAMPLQRVPDRVILGADDAKIARVIERVFEPFKRPILTMSLREAEIVKHATNAYVANQVSFIGEIAQVCDEYGADAMPISKALKLDKRCGPFAYVRPGLGFNGGTVRRDVMLLSKLASDKKRSAPLMDAIIEVNERTNNTVVERLVAVLKKPKGKKVGLLGLTYKALTSTLRHSLALQMAGWMMEHGMALRAYDPIIPPGGRGIGSEVHEWSVPDEIEVCSSIAEVAAGADALVVMTDKDDFRGLDLKRLGKTMRKRILVDAVGFYDSATAAKAGFQYITIGRGFRWR